MKPFNLSAKIGNKQLSINNDNVNKHAKAVKETAKSLFNNIKNAVKHSVEEYKERSKS